MVAIFIIPLIIIVGVLLRSAGDPIDWPSSSECHLANMNGADCNHRYKVEHWFKIATWIPAIGIALSIHVSVHYQYGCVGC